VEAVPGVWIKKSALKAALVGRSANSDSAVARIGGRRLGPYEVLQASHRPQGEQRAKDFLLLRPATGEAAAALPPTPSAAELAAAAAAASYETEEEEEEGGPPAAAAAVQQAATSLRQQGPSAAAAAGAPLLPTAPTASTHGLPPPALASALAALPPPGPGDAKPEERRALLRGSLPGVQLPGGELPTPAAELPSPPAAQPASAPPPPLSLFRSELLEESFPPALAAALKALPPLGPDDAAPGERRALLSMALPAGALPLPETRPVGRAWRPKLLPLELKVMCLAFRLLRVRRRRL